MKSKKIIGWALMVGLLVCGFVVLSKIAGVHVVLMAIGITILVIGIVSLSIILILSD